VTDVQPRFAVTVDLVVLTVRDGVLCVLLVRRGIDPWLGAWALPGGFVHDDEDLPDAAARELVEETGRRPALGAPGAASPPTGAPGRDPRLRVVSVAYLALAPDLPDPVAGTDAAGAAWVPVARATGTGLAFDHARILADGVERARAKLEYSPLATAFCPPRFTVAQLRAVYEAVWGHRIDPRNFHRKVTSVPGLLVETDELRVEGRGPARRRLPARARDRHPPAARAGVGTGTVSRARPT